MITQGLSTSTIAYFDALNNVDSIDAISYQDEVIVLANNDEQSTSSIIDNQAGTGETNGATTTIYNG